MSDAGISQQHVFRKAFGSFLAALSHHGPWWYGINLQSNNACSLATICGFEDTDDLFLIYKNCGLNGKKNTIEQKLLTSFLDEIGLSCSSSSASEIVKAKYEDNKHCVWIRLGTCPAPKWKPLEIFSRIRPTIPNLLQLQLTLHAACPFLSCHKSASIPLCIGGLLYEEEEEEEEEEASSSNNPPIVSSESEKKRQEENKVMMALLWNRFLPLLLKKADNKQATYFLKPENIGPNAVQVLIEVASSMMQIREKAKSEMVGGGEISPKDELDLPVFDAHGIDRHNSRTLQSLLRELILVDQATTNHNLLSTTMSNNKVVTLIRVPKSTSLAQMKDTDRKVTAWSKKLIGQFHDGVKDPPTNTPARELFPMSNDDDNNNDIILQQSTLETVLNQDERAAANLLVFFGEKFPRSFDAATRVLTIVCSKPMDAVKTFAMWSEANISGLQSRIISRHLRFHFGSSLCCGEAKVKEQLSGHAIIEAKTAVFFGGNERIDWSCRNPAELTLAYLSSLFNNQLTRCDYHLVDLVLSIDHGKGFSRAHLVVIARRQEEDDDGEVNFVERSEVFSLAEAKCKKDSYRVQRGAFMPTINEGITALNTAGAVDIYRRPSGCPPTDE